VLFYFYIYEIYKYLIMFKYKITLLILLPLLLLSCSQQAKEPETDLTEYAVKGRAIVKETFSVLNETLTEKIQNEGVESAIKFCNVQAYPITNEKAEKHKVEIKRLAIKNRNQDNKADNEAKALMVYYENLKNMNRDLSKLDTTILQPNGKIRFLKPIVLQGQCVVCHGKVGEQITDNTYKLITALYPEDRATNFQAGDLRGIWSISFEE
jgi:hypothetical protein